MKSKRKILLLASISLGVILLLLTVFLLAPFCKTKPFEEGDYAYGTNFVATLEGVPVMRQTTAVTCGITSMAIVKSYLGLEATERDILNLLNIPPKGMLPNDYLKYAKTVFAPLAVSVSMVSPKSQAEILNVISRSLKNGLPVIIFYAVPDDWNKPHFNTHYSVVYGLDMKAKTVKISNPYGYLQELAFAELYDGLDFTGYKGMPFGFRVAEKFGTVKRNTLIVFEK